MNRDQLVGRSMFVLACVYVVLIAGGIV